jgi:hypothetical protein
VAKLDGSWSMPVPPGRGGTRSADRSLTPPLQRRDTPGVPGTRAPSVGVDRFGASEPASADQKRRSREKCAGEMCV